MRFHACRATALLFLALTGCHSIMPGFSTSSSNSSPQPLSGTAQANFLPNLTPGNIDGSGPGQQLELPKQKKVEACLATAKLMEESGKVAEAAHYYEQIRQLDPRRDLFCARRLSVLYDRKGDFDKALDEYAKLLKDNPRDADAYNDLGYGYYSRGKFEAAEKNLRLAVELDPKNKRAWSNLGMSLAQLGRYEESLAAFEKVVNRPQAMCNIGFIQAAQGKWLEARDSYAMALKLEPGLQKARVALERMEEGPKSNRDKDLRDARRKFREKERVSPPDPALAGGMPFGAPVGGIGADAGMVFISDDDVPINLPVPGSYTPPASVPAPPPTPAPAVPQSVDARRAPLTDMPPPPLPLPPSPSSLYVP